MLCHQSQRVEDRAFWSEIEGPSASQTISSRRRCLLRQHLVIMIFRVQTRMQTIWLAAMWAQSKVMCKMLWGSNMPLSSKPDYKVAYSNQGGSDMPLCSLARLQSGIFEPPVSPYSTFLYSNHAGRALRALPAWLHCGVVTGWRWLFDGRFFDAVTEYVRHSTDTIHVMAQ